MKRIAIAITLIIGSVLTFGIFLPVLLAYVLTRNYPEKLGI